MGQGFFGQGFDDDEKSTTSHIINFINFVGISFEWYIYMNILKTLILSHIDFSAISIDTHYMKYKDEGVIKIDNETSQKDIWKKS